MSRAATDGVRGATVGRVIAIDWSGARDARGVWLADVCDGQVTRLEAPGSRERAIAYLVEAAQSGPRVAAGLDFAFSYPAWFLEERGCADVFAFWELVAREGEQWLALAPYPFWTLRTRARGETGPRALRSTDREASGRRVTPKSVFQIAGPGQVGTMSIRGMPHLRTLRANGFAVWPFETPAPAQPVALEIYPRRYYGDAVVKGDGEARARYLARYGTQIEPEHRAVAERSDHAFDALTAALTMWERRDTLADLVGDGGLEGRIWGT